MTDELSVAEVKECICQEIRDLCYALIVVAKKDEGACPVCDTSFSVNRNADFEKLCCPNGCFLCEVNFWSGNEHPTAGLIQYSPFEVLEFTCDCGIKVYITDKAYSPSKTLLCNGCNSPFKQSKSSE